MYGYNLPYKTYDQICKNLLEGTQFFLKQLIVSVSIPDEQRLVSACTCREGIHLFMTNSINYLENNHIDPSRILMVGRIL
jgi:hypothetical protein